MSLFERVITFLVVLLVAIIFGLGIYLHYTFKHSAFSHNFDWSEWIKGGFLLLSFIVLLWLIIWFLIRSGK